MTTVGVESRTLNPKNTSTLRSVHPTPPECLFALPCDWAL